MALRTLLLVAAWGVVLALLVVLVLVLAAVTSLGNPELGSYLGTY